MATNNSSNQDYSNETDGFILGGGNTKRNLTVTGADITLTGSGTNTYTFPSSTDTLVGRASTDTLTNKTLTSPVINTGVSGTAIKDEDDMASNSATHLATQQSIKAYVDNAIATAKQALLPVGSIVVLGVSTNPNTLYGFGTWTRIQGRMIVGVSDTDNDFDLDDTGGAKTHTLTISEMPSHNHGLSSVGVSPTTPGYSGWQADVGASGTAVLYRASANTNNTGSGNPHPIMNPYIAKYIWQRVS